MPAVGGAVIPTLERPVRRVQAEARVPAISAAVHRGDRPLWTFTVGTSGTEIPLSPGTLFRIGSISKTFTAVLVMQCRDDGLLDLDDRIAQHMPVKAHGELTVGRMLAHLSGLQREPFGDVWDTMDAPDVETLLAQLDRAEQVLRPGLRFHYSNLAFALLGHLVGRLCGGTWDEVLRARILEPLGLNDTASTPTRPAVGYQLARRQRGHNLPGALLSHLVRGDDAGMKVPARGSTHRRRSASLNAPGWLSIRRRNRLSR